MTDDEKRALKYDCMFLGMKQAFELMFNHHSYSSYQRMVSEITDKNTILGFNLNQSRIQVQMLKNELDKMKKETNLK